MRREFLVLIVLYRMIMNPKVDDEKGDLKANPLLEFALSCNCYYIHIYWPGQVCQAERACLQLNQGRIASHLL